MYIGRIYCNCLILRILATNRSHCFSKKELPRTSVRGSSFPVVLPIDAIHIYVLAYKQPTVFHLTNLEWRYSMVMPVSLSPSVSKTRTGPKFLAYRGKSTGSPLRLTGHTGKAASSFSTLFPAKRPQRGGQSGIVGTQGMD